MSRSWCTTCCTSVESQRDTLASSAFLLLPHLLDHKEWEKGPKESHCQLSFPLCTFFRSYKATLFLGTSAEKGRSLLNHRNGGTVAGMLRLDGAPCLLGRSLSIPAFWCAVLEATQRGPRLALISGFSDSKGVLSLLLLISVQPDLPQTLPWHCNAPYLPTAEKGTKRLSAFHVSISHLSSPILLAGVLRRPIHT